MDEIKELHKQLRDAEKNVRKYTSEVKKIRKRLQLICQHQDKAVVTKIQNCSKYYVNGCKYYIKCGVCNKILLHNGNSSQYKEFLEQYKGKIREELVIK